MLDVHGPEMFKYNKTDSRSDLAIKSHQRAPMDRESGKFAMVRNI